MTDSSERLIHRRFARVACGARERVALCTPSRDTTFGQLLDGMEHVADLLASLECIGPDRIAIVSSDHAVVVTALLGVLEAGCVFVPLDDSSEERLGRQLAVLSCRAIVVDARSRPRVAALLDGVHDRAPAILELDIAGPGASERWANSRRSIDREAPCAIHFTSGSTGTPRAIVGRLSGIDHHVAWEIAHLGLDRSVRGAIIHSSSYDAYLPDVLVPLCAGGVACAPTPGADLCAWIEDERITLLHCTPSVFRGLLADERAARLTHLRHVLLAGEVVRPADVRTARAVLGDHVRLTNLYGPTEATLVKLHHEITAADGERDAVPIGVPMPEVTVYILDEHDQPSPDGAIGQIAIQSAYGSHGYLDEPALTHERFRAAPDGSREQLYLTGDYGRRLPDGNITFNGRRDRQIKLCGARVDLDEVEAILSSCDGVVESVVVPDDTVLRGFVVLAASATLAHVRAQAARRLSPAMRLAWLTQLDAFPRTTSGKIDRRHVAENRGSR